MKGETTTRNPCFYKPVLERFFLQYCRLSHSLQQLILSSNHAFNIYQVKAMLLLTHYQKMYLVLQQIYIFIDVLNTYHTFTYFTYNHILHAFIY